MDIVFALVIALVIAVVIVAICCCAGVLAADITKDFIDSKKIKAIKTQNEYMESIGVARYYRFGETSFISCHDVDCYFCKFRHSRDDFPDLSSEENTIKCKHCGEESYQIRR